MKTLSTFVAIILIATATGCATRYQEAALAGGLVGGAVGLGVGRASAPGYAQSGAYRQPYGTYYQPLEIHVPGARHLPNGRCEILVNSRWLRGVDRNGMCFVVD